MPANLLCSVSEDRRAEGFRYQLRAQTNPQHRDALLNGLANQLHFHSEVRMLGMLIDIHRTAQHYKTIIAIHVGVGVGMSSEVGVTQTKSTGFQHGVKRSENFERDMLKHKQASHGALSSCSIIIQIYLLMLRTAGMISSMNSCKERIPSSCVMSPKGKAVTR